MFPPPPSYQEATIPPDCMSVVGPYVSFTDYYSLCLVDHRSWNVFAPLLWHNILHTARQLGTINDSNDLSWWADFVSVKLAAVRLCTRRLVRILDFRDFASQGLFTLTNDNPDQFTSSLRTALQVLEKVNVLLLDRRDEVSASLIDIVLADSRALPKLLSIPHCPARLPVTFFASRSLQNLVYLDISYLPGSIWPIFPNLPNLRILKLAGRNLTDSVLDILHRPDFMQLWSLDVSHNKLTDDAIPIFIRRFQLHTYFRWKNFVEVEGKLRRTIGWFVFIDESRWSGSFSHPDRYVLDVPPYVADIANVGRKTVRSDCSQRVRRDSLNAASMSLSDQSVNWIDIETAYRQARGITHLDLSYNQISTRGIESLLCESSGQLEHFSCATMPLVPMDSRLRHIWPISSYFEGIVGLAHMFRPIYSSNLQSLRIHHSLVTNVLSIVKCPKLPCLYSLRLAETLLRRHVDQAYPQRFIPDMNPRLSSLTLTCLPLFSCGPLIARLIEFLNLLSIQEGDIQKARRRAWPHKLPMLRGMRLLQLEFTAGSDPDADSLDSLNAQQLLSSEEESCSFCGKVNSQEVFEPAWKGEDAVDTDVLEVESDMLRLSLERGGSHFRLDVWVGPAEPHWNPIVNEYRRLVMSHANLRLEAAATTPSQVLSGAPQGVTLFQDAWRAAMMMVPVGGERTKRSGGEAGERVKMQSVISALKKYRRETRAQYDELLEREKNGQGGKVGLGAPHYHWTGNLVIKCKGTIV